MQARVFGSYPIQALGAVQRNVKRTVKLITEQKTIDKPSVVEGFPMRAWNIRVFLLDENGQEIPASIFEKAVYKLHPSFPNPTQSKRSGDDQNRGLAQELTNPGAAVKSPPFKIQEEGWGEFDMTIILTCVDKGGDHTVKHDLNFQSERYEAKHVITFKNPKPALLAALRETGPVPGDENGLKKKGGRGEDDSLKKRKRGGQNIDMEKLADGLQKLQEDDLLQVVQMVHEHKTSETYLKNDVEQGEFHVDLYTLPDSLIKMLWEFTNSKVEI
ncbi:MAG: hypothetical protein M1817_005635 [Caeruleum heppii]|nr:MAG: hypothetical protein M1817_005635 [Caeruleum heppii]